MTESLATPKRSRICCDCWVRSQQLRSPLGLRFLTSVDGWRAYAPLGTRCRYRSPAATGGWPSKDIGQLCEGVGATGPVSVPVILTVEVANPPGQADWAATHAPALHPIHHSASRFSLRITADVLDRLVALTAS